MSRWIGHDITHSRTW